MATENERKFLVSSHEWRADSQIIDCLQAFLSISHECTTRVRVTNRGSFITVKGPTVKFSRKEYEYQISTEDAHEMIALSPYAPINKSRHLYDFEGYTWEIDVFHGDNEGLIIAEVEFADHQNPAEIPLPEWLGEEVSHDHRYFNTYLAQNPYKTWK